METIYQAMNRNITFRENISCQIKEITYNTDSTYPSAQDPVEFLSQLKVKATGLMLMQIVDRMSYEPPPGPVYIPWIEKNGSIILSTITGLEASKSYTIRMLVS